MSGIFSCKDFPAREGDVVAGGDGHFLGRDRLVREGHDPRDTRTGDRREGEHMPRDGFAFAVGQTESAFCAAGGDVTVDEAVHMRQTADARVTVHKAAEMLAVPGPEFRTR